MKNFKSVFFLFLCLCFLGNVFATDFPTKPIRLIVPWASGGFTDILGRVLAEKISKSLGQPVIVENRPGASGAIGSEYVARSNADGYTLLITTSDSLVRLMKDKSFDPLRDFSHVTLIATQPVLLAVGSGVPARSLGEFVAMAKNKPGKISYGSPGEGGAVHLAMELFSNAAGIQMIHVPYKGINPALTDVLGGQVDSILISLQGAGGNIKSGKLRPLAITSLNRSPIAMDIPTLSESGYPKFELTLWYALTGPKGISQEILDILNREVKAALSMPDVNEKLTGANTNPIGSSPEQLRNFTRDEIAKWGMVVK
jgi:tripartite-type tricarboxylate transporter receptor subunit TctC